MTAIPFHRTRGFRRWVLLAAAAALAVLAVKLSFFGSDGPPPTTMGVVTADIEDVVLASGTLEASKLVSIGAQVSGQIKSLKVALGDQVTKGQLIAEIDSLTQQNALREANAALENMRAQRRAKDAGLKQSALAFERQKRMLAQDATAKADYETAEAALNTAKADIAALSAQIDQAAVAVDTAKVALNYTRISAPMDGTVVALSVQEGQTVNAAQSAPTIIMLAQLDSMTIKAQISEADVTRVRPDQKVYFTILGEPDNRYDATLRAVEPGPTTLSSATTTSTGASSSSSSSSSSSASSSAAIYYNGLFDVPNPQRKLRISMTAQVSIVIRQAKAALTIASSLLGNPEADGAYTLHVLKDGQPSPRKVRIGINNNVNAQVLEGLAEGDQIVVENTGLGASQPARRGPPPMRL